MGHVATEGEASARRGIFTTVACYPLHIVLEAANLTKLDYLALDLEGMELQVYIYPII